MQKPAFVLVSNIALNTAHGYAAAWLAIRMLFRPRRDVRVLGIKIWPQGMIPRHRARLAQSIGNAVGNELVSQETVVSALFDTDFFRTKVEVFVDSYTNELLSTNYPSFIEALPSGARAPILDAISALQYRLADYIAGILKSEETVIAVSEFVDRQVDQILAQRLSTVISDDTSESLLAFVEERVRLLVNEPGFEQKVRDFVSVQLDALSNSRATLAELFTHDTVAILKDRIDRQVPPIVHQLANIATAQKTRTRIGLLIKREVDEYYEHLSFLKKIFVSRDRIHREVDEMVNNTLPRKVEEYLRGEAFEQEAEGFLNSTIDDVLSRPINELVGQIAPDKLEIIKTQIAHRLLAIARGPELSTSVLTYTSDALKRLRPHTMRAVLETFSNDSTYRLKGFLTKGLLTVLSRDETARTINAILSSQIERLLISPIGNLRDQIPENSIARTSSALTERITNAARDRLPHAIAEFDVGGIVRSKVEGYPVEKLETLILSVAQQHLRTIEVLGGVIGFVLGVISSIFFKIFLNLKL